jgi:hypothetical protein
VKGTRSSAVFSYRDGLRGQVDINLANPRIAAGSAWGACQASAEKRRHAGVAEVLDLSARSPCTALPILATLPASGNKRFGVHGESFSHHGASRW